MPGRRFRPETGLPHAVDEIPAKLRKELEEFTNSFNSATILIADRRGREEIVKALNGMPSSLRSRLAHSLTPRPAGERRSRKQSCSGHALRATQLARDHAPRRGGADRVGRVHLPIAVRAGGNALLPR
jgi:hypothetical protein